MISTCLDPMHTIIILMKRDPVLTSLPESGLSFQVINQSSAILVRILYSLCFPSLLFFQIIHSLVLSVIGARNNGKRVYTVRNSQHQMHCSSSYQHNITSVTFSGPPCAKSLLCVISTKRTSSVCYDQHSTLFH
jgi:hypothetical protein